MNNDTQELDALYRANVGRIYRFFYLKTLNRSIAEDLTSETFLRYAKSIRERSVEKHEAFLYGIGKIVFVEYLKKKYRAEIPVDDELLDFYSHTEDLSREFSNSEKLMAILISLLPELPPKQAEILRLRLIEKLSMKEICEKLGKPDFYVKTTQNRAIKSIKKLIATRKLIKKKYT